MIGLKKYLEKFMNLVRGKNQRSGDGGSGVEGQKTINFGSGDNPLPGAVNVDMRRLNGVNVQANVNQLPFVDEAFDAAVSINPYRYNPVNPETARVLKPGSVLAVAGQPNNPFFRKFLNRATQKEMSALGFELIERGPAAETLKFGSPKTTTGDELSTNVFIQAKFRRIR